MSEFVFLFRSTEADANEAMGTPEAAQQSMQAMLAWIRELETKGHLKNPGQPLERTGKVLDGRKKTVIDGPYAESKDSVLGYLVIEARDIDEAVKLGSKCPMVEGGAMLKIRPVLAF